MHQGPRSRTLHHLAAILAAAGALAEAGCASHPDTVSTQGAAAASSETPSDAVPAAGTATPTEKPSDAVPAAGTATPTEKPSDAVPAPGAAAPLPRDDFAHGGDVEIDNPPVVCDPLPPPSHCPQPAFQGSNLRAFIETEVSWHDTFVTVHMMSRFSIVDIGSSGWVSAVTGRIMNVPVRSRREVTVVVQPVKGVVRLDVMASCGIDRLENRVEILAPQGDQPPSVTWSIPK